MGDFPKNQMLGFCSACGISVINLKKDKKKASAKFAENYREHIIELSNNTIMRIGVCDRCKVELVSGKSKNTADKIVKNHITFWENHTKQAPKNYKLLSSTNSNTTARDFIRKREKMRNEEKLNQLLTNKII